MTEVRSIRLAGYAGVVGVLLLAATFLVANWTDPADGDQMLLRDIADADAQAYTAFTMLTPGVALLLWFAVGLRRYLLVRCRADRLAGAVVPGMAVFTGLSAVGISLILAVPMTSSWFDRYTIDVDTFRVLATCGIFVLFAGTAGAGATVAATSRAAQLAGAIPMWLAWVGYVVAVGTIVTLWTFGFTMLLLGLWLLGASIGLVLGAASMTGPAAAPAAVASAGEIGSMPGQSVAPAEETRPQQPTG